MAKIWKEQNCRPATHLVPVSVGRILRAEFDVMDGFHYSDTV